MKKNNFFVSFLTKIFLFAVLIVLSGVAPSYNVKAAPVTVSCSGTAGAPTAVDEASLAGDDVTFSDAGGDGYCEVDTAMTGVNALSSVVVDTGVTLTHTATDTDGITIETTGNFTVATGAYVNANAKGSAGGANEANDGTGVGYGYKSTTYGLGGGGAGYGGAGGAGTFGAGGVIYGSAANPTDLGSGGGAGRDGNVATNDESGGAGGGLVNLNVAGNLTVNGAISADGEDGHVWSGISGGGGSGGSVKILADTLIGSGTITADGGSSSTNGGGGGGGRVAVYYNTLNGFTISTATITAAGGTSATSVKGNTGTTFILDRKTDDGSGNVIVTAGLQFEDGVDYTRTSFNFKDGAVVTCGTSDFATLDIAATGTITFDDTSWDCSTVSTVTFSANQWAMSGTNTMGFTRSGATVDWDIATDLTLTNMTYTGAAAATLATEGVLSMDNSIAVNLVNSDVNSSVNWTNISNLTIDATSSIAANNKGYPGGLNEVHDGTGPGLGYKSTAYNQGGGGAGYGGLGGAGTSGAGGTTYGSATNPTDLGSGGGSGKDSAVAVHDESGGAGGGIVNLSITDTLTVNGALSADGEDGHVYNATVSGGGGSGGSIKVTTGAISGSGTIAAAGGSSSANGGGGGGGRVFISYGGDTSTFLAGLTASAAAPGGTGNVAGGVGTLSLSQIVYLSSSTITDTGGYTSDTTPVITLLQGGATPTHVAFSCNNSDWSSWLTYPDDDVVNDGDGPAFDITTGATGCSATEGSKTIYAKIKDGTSTSSVVSDTTTYDGTNPSGLGSFLNTVADSTSMTFTWTASSDTNFDHYEIWYGTELADVQGRTGTAAEWDNGDDSNLATAGTTTTTITGVDLGNKYYKIWAVDLVSNSETLTELFVSLGGSQSPNVYAPTGLTVEDYEDGAVKVSWDDPTAGEANQIMVYRGIEPYPVNGTPITYVSVGTEYYIDYGVEDGDTVTYMLKSKNGTTYSSITSPVSFTVGSTLTTEDTTDTPTEDTTEDTDIEDTTDTSDTTIGDTGGSSGSASEDEDEDEEEDEQGSSLDDLGISVPDHWSEGYLKNLGEEDRVIEEAVQTMSFFDMLMDMFQNPDTGMNRGEALQFLLTLANYTATESAVNSFDDVTADHERGYLIEFAADNGLVQGYPDGTFRPEEVVNRAEALKMAAYFFGLDAEELYGEELLAYYGLTENPFVDVDIEAWYAPHVIFAYSNGVVQGYQDGTHRFGPENDVTYAEFVKIATLMRDFENAVELASELE